MIITRKMTHFYIINFLECKPLKTLINIVILDIFFALLALDKDIIFSSFRASYGSVLLILIKI